MATDIRFGLIGLGLMGREFASAAARWSHLTNVDARPILTAACDTNEDAFGWFKENGFKEIEVLAPSVSQIGTKPAEVMRYTA